MQACIDVSIWCCLLLPAALALLTAVRVLLTGQRLLPPPCKSCQPPWVSRCTLRASASSLPSGCTSLQALLSIFLWFVADVLKVLIAKKMASHFHQETYFLRMQEALRKVCQPVWSDPAPTSVQTDLVACEETGLTAMCWQRDRAGA